MTQTRGAADSALSGATGRTAGAGPLADAADSEAADRLKEEVQQYLTAQAERLLVGAGRKLGGATGRLNDIAEGNSPGLTRLALDGGRKIAQGKGPVRTALELGASRAKDNVMGAFKNLGGSKRKRGAGKKPTVIIEQIDVGLPLRTAYDQWTQYQDFSTFAKGVKSASRSDDIQSDWKLKVFWSNRSWKARTTEQVPDDRIAWSSEGAKGTTKGVVSFHRLADSLTRVVLVIEYYPSGFFEKTGNVWRAQGRRARLDLKNFARFITLKNDAEDSWRGEIRDGEVVRSHEDAIAEEEREKEEAPADGVEEEAEPEEDHGEEEDEEAEDEYDEEEDEEGYEDEDQDEYESEGEEEDARAGSRR